MLQSPQMFGSLNSLDTMTKLIMKLPFDLHHKWVKQSVFIENQTGRVAQFNDFVNFVKAQSKESNSVVPNLFWCRGRISNFRVRVEPHENTQVFI